jgi:hypothetical protein
MMLKETLRGVVRAQREELALLELGTPREMLGSIDLGLPFATVLSGIRRCGKSTLLRQLMGKTKGPYYFNFEDPRAAAFELSDFQKLDEVFAEEFGKSDRYFFDEIQNVGKWELFVRAKLDQKKRFFITGSNASMLSKELGTRLTGRHLKRELFPFSYREFLAFTSKKEGVESFRQYLRSGGFPEYVEYGKAEMLHELFNDIIARDVVVRQKLRSAKTITEMALYLISNTGKEFSYNGLRKTFELGSTNSAVDFVSYLEDAYLLFTVPKFDYSLRKQRANPKKVYSVDNGLSTANTASFSADNGRMLENHVFMDLKRRGKDVYYFRENKECDFIVKDKGKAASAIQVCYELDEDNKKRELEGLLEAMDKLGLKEGTILTMDAEDKLTLNGRTVRVTPAWKWSIENPQMTKKSSIRASPACSLPTHAGTGKPASLGKPEGKRI